MHSQQLSSGNTVHFHGDGKGEVILYLADKVADGEGTEIRIPASDLYEFVDLQRIMNNYKELPPSAPGSDSQAIKLLGEIRRRAYNVARTDFTFQFTRRNNEEDQYQLILLPPKPGCFLIMNANQGVQFTTTGGIVDALETLLTLMETQELEP